MLDNLTEWQTAQTQLQQAAHVFRDACTMLYQKIDQSYVDRGDSSLIELEALEIYGKMRVLEDHENIMTEARRILHKITNRSTTLVRINILPSEVLCRVFELVISSGPFSDSFYFHKSHPVIAIVAVCTRWRHIIIGNPLLWSGISICGTGPGYLRKEKMLQRAQLWLERSRGAQLHLNFSGRGEHGAAAEPLITMLRPHAARMSSITFTKADSTYLQTIFGLLASRSPATLTTFAADIYTYSDSSRQTTVDWGIAPLRGLTDLQLTGLPDHACPSMDNFVSVLASSPHLHTLKLTKMRKIAIHQSTYQTIKLPCLKLLDLSLDCGPICTTLIPLLELGQTEIEVRLEVYFAEHNLAIPPIQSLFRRSSVAKLMVWGLQSNFTTELSGFLDNLPNLRELVIEYNNCRNICDMELGSLLISAGEESVVAKCPDLRTLSIDRCIIGSAAQRHLQAIVITYSLKNLLFGPSIRFSIAKSKDPNKNTLLAPLRQRVENVVYNPISDVY